MRMKFPHLHLRDLFWLVLVVAVGVSGCTAASNDAARRSQVEMDSQLNRLKLGETKLIYLYDTQDTDDLLEKVRGMVEVEELDLDLTDVSDNGMRHVATLPKLRRLHIYAGGVSDQGLSLLKSNQSITSLELSNTLVTDDGLRGLTELPNLQSLTICFELRIGPRLSDAGISHLKYLRNLETLVIGGDWASDHAINELRSEMPNCKITRQP